MIVDTDSRSAYSIYAVGKARNVQALGSLGCKGRVGEVEDDLGKLGGALRIEARYVCKSERGFPLVEINTLGSI